MLKVTEHGVTITLNGKPPTDGVFWFASALLIGAMGVVVAMSVLPRGLAIGALALLVVASFVFNRMRQNQQQQKSAKLISTGVIDVQAGMISHNSGTVQDRIMVQTTDTFENHGTSLTVFDSNQQKKCHLSGFENAKEVEIVQQVLQGKSLSKRHATIKMRSS